MEKPGLLFLRTRHVCVVGVAWRASAHFSYFNENRSRRRVKEQPARVTPTHKMPKVFQEISRAYPNMPKRRPNMNFSSCSRESWLTFAFWFLFAAHTSNTYLSIDS